jgi:hypothetical protein
MKSDRERKTNAFGFRNPYSVPPYISITTELIQTGYFCDFSLKRGILVNYDGGWIPLQISVSAADSANGKSWPALFITAPFGQGQA